MDAIKKYRQRRSARLGIETFQHYDSVDEYRRRRDERLKARFDKEDDGEWKTTDSGHKILIKDGTVVGGNPFAVARMGEPEGKELPKTVKLSGEKKMDDFFLKNNRDQIAEALDGNDGKCIFGGFYKVDDSKGYATFFNPHTGERFSTSTTVRKAGPWGMEDYTDNLGTALGKIEPNEQVTKLYNRCTGNVQKGDTIRVVAGKTLAHGTEAKVRGVFVGRFGKYLYLDNGEKIQAKNVSIVDEDGSLVRSKEGADHEELKKSHEEYRAEKKAKSAVVSKEAITSAIGSAKTRKSIADALKKAGYKFEDRTDEQGYTDFKINTPDGGYARIYVKGSGRSKETVVQMWTPYKEAPLKPDYEINGAKRIVKTFLKNWEKNSSKKFEDLDSGTQYAYVLAKQASYLMNVVGIEPKRAWTRAIDAAKYWASKDFEGYGEEGGFDDAGKKVLEGIIDEMKKSIVR